MQWEPILYLVLLLIVSVAAFGYATVRRNTWLRLAAGYTGGITTLFWITGVEAGPAEISDLWPVFKLGLIPFLAALAFWYCFRIASLWFRVPIAVASSIVGLPTGFFLLIVLVMQGTCTRRLAPLYSPDGGHAAIVRFSMQGALGSDGARIWVRKTGSPFSADAYIGYAWQPRNGEVSPRVQWLDSSRLLIQFLEDPRGRKPICPERAGEISIRCEPLARQ